MFARILVLGFLTAVALAIDPVSAQTMYKSTMPDGSVVYGDREEPGAVKVETSQPDTSKTGVQINPPGAKGVVDRAQGERQSSASSAARLREAQESVRRAEAALANGKEPLPGERTGTASGGSRLNDSYWARQKKLSEDVAKARDALGRLQSGGDQ